MNGKIGDWKNAWNEFYAGTEELTVIVKDSSLKKGMEIIYEGAIELIPETLEAREVQEVLRIIDSNVRERIGACCLVI